MTSPLITVSKEMTLKECAQKMKENHIHHVPVMDHTGTVVGMISATDFLVAAEAMARKEGETIS
jgi:CBS domain-containing protein